MPIEITNKVTGSLPLYLVEMVNLDQPGDESTATRRRRQRIAAATALQAIADFVQRNSGRILTARETGPDRATAIWEASGDTVYRIYAFPMY